MQAYKRARHFAIMLLTASTLFCGLAHAQSLDGIAAVVNDEVITLRTLELEIQEVEKSLQAQEIPAPESEILQKQVLQRLIDERIIAQEAQQIGVDTDAINTEEAAQEIAERNDLSLDELRTEIEKGGLDWDSYLKGLRQEVLMSEIRQYVIDPEVTISESEIDLYLKTQGIDPNANTNEEGGAASANDVIELAQILIAVPDGASRSEQQQLQQKAEEIRQQLQSGADFAGLAAAESDGPEALQGGKMGARALDGWPDLFTDAIEQVEIGEFSEIVRSGAGFHILQVVNRGPDQNQQAKQTASAEGDDMVITQTHARHILIKLSEITSDDKAEEQIRHIATRIADGENFEELARVHSEDASAPQGGDLGWLNPGETVPAFEQAMDALADGEVSEPVRSQFGWHIIQVEARRERNVGSEYQRMQARQALHEQRVESVFDDWLSRVRSQAFIDNRIDPEASSGRR